ncbi:MAG: glycosyl hydrolase [Woeseiaceae bacterium]|nr:glycosyl hydrolase [Woeseiaceae bacterium]
MTRTLLLAPLFFFLALAAPAPAEEDAGIQYRLVGPASGGRTTRVVGIPGDPLTYYLSTAAGGVWKSSNGGLEWKPVFDDQPVSSIGAVALAATNPGIVYVGAGEANIRGNVGEGNGIYRSLDGGKNWDHVWEAEGQIGTIVVHPDDENIVFAAALGSPFGPGPARGVYRSKDGGDSWQRVLFVDNETGASDIAFDEQNPNILFAGLWQTRRTPWSMQSGGPGSGLYRSRDGGDTWSQLRGAGLPDGTWGKVGVRVAPSDPERVYALIEAEDGGLFRSDDGGDSWQHINDSAGLRQRAWYYMTLTIDPVNADVVWFPQVSMLKTIDGGRSVLPAKAGGWDHHDVWIDPANPERIAEASDAGVSLSWDGGDTWVRPPLAIGQFYHLSVDTRTPYRVMGSLQDFGTRAGPSNSLHDGGILLGDWGPVGGGEAGFVVADPNDPNIVYAGEYLGYLSRYDERTGQAPHVGIYPDNGSGHGAENLRHRFQWTAPILISPHDNRVVYHASNFLQKTRDGGQSWTTISPDLTRNDKSKQQWSGGPITGDNTGVEFYGTIFALAESPLEAGVIWAGTDDGLVHITRDAGKNWRPVTPRGAPEWATVATIEASRWAAGTAYVVYDAHRLDDETPYIWKTTNFGESWTSLARGLDTEVYLKVVREDPKQRGILYLGTERGVMVSRNEGRNWESLQLNMPTVAIADMVVTGDDLVVGTLGRSAWILDDLTPIREMSADIAKKPVHLFAPRPAIRWTYAAAPDGSTAGKASNPAKGAIFSYHLAEPPDTEVVLEILDGDGEIIRRLSSEPEPPYLPADHPDADPEQKQEAALEAVAGFNRGSWDLAFEGARRIPGSTNDAGNVNVGPLVPPGEYRVRLTVADTRVEQPLTVLSDPRSTATLPNLKAQSKFLLEVRDRISSITADAERLRSLREQLEVRHKALADDPRASRLVTLGENALEKITGIEKRLYNPNAEVNYDILAGRDGGAKLYSRFGWLYRTALDHNGPPTQGMREVNDELSALYEESKLALQQLLDEELGQLNDLAEEMGAGYLTVRSD